MEFEGKNRSPYKGVLLVCLVQILGPLLMYFLFRLAVGYYQDFSAYISKCECVAFAYGIGTVISLCFAISGGWTVPFAAVCSRISDFFTNMAVSPGFAFSCYWRDMKVNGVVFILYFGIFVFELLLTVNAVYSFLQVWP